MILLCLVTLAVMTGYGIVGFSGVIGIVHTWEMYLLIVAYGLVLGSIQSYTRTAYTDVVPPGQESEFFGIYEISDKGSSWMGPAIVTILISITGQMRVGFFYLSGMSLVGWYLVYKTDFEEGAEACRRKEIQVRMEGIRKKLGVSKIAIQMQAKKVIGLKSSTASSQSGVGSSASSMGSSASSTEEIESSKGSGGAERSVLEKDMKEMSVKDVSNAPVDSLLQRGSILETGQKIADVIPRRKSSFLSMRSQATSGGGGSNERSSRELSSSGERRSTSRRPSAMLSIQEAKATASLSNNKVAPAT